MVILQIEHAVPSFEGWKKAFESDPIGRQKGGVQRYRISRKVDDPNFIIVDMEFTTQNQAENFLTSLHSLWRRVEGTVITGPTARIIEIVETKEY